MATYAAYRHVELDNVGYGKKRVLKPPGGGSSDIFGSGPEETSPRRVRNHNQSQLGSALFDSTPSSHSSQGSITNGDPNPVTGAGYPSDHQNNAPVMSNGQSTGANSPSNSSVGEKSSDSSSAGRTPAAPRTRVPPGGYSSGLW